MKKGKFKNNIIKLSLLCLLMQTAMPGAISYVLANNIEDTWIHGENPDFEVATSSNVVLQNVQTVSEDFEEINLQELHSIIQNLEAPI